MLHAADTFNPATPSRLDRALSFVSDVRPGEGRTVVLMLANIFVLLICYSVLKTVREPLILLGGGAEVRSYAAAGQALALIAFVPLYGWFASRVNRATLLLGMGLFFIAGLELFAAAVTARVPYVGVAFFIWVGIFNISLVAQFWSFANDIYSKDAGDRLFPLITIGMTAGAPLGSIAAARLFHSGIAPASILQVAALLLATSIGIYHLINRRDARRPASAPSALRPEGGFRLVLANPYLRLVAALVVLLNVVNTTGEYLVARLLTAHVNELAMFDAGFDKQAFIGDFTGTYQFWVNIAAFLIQLAITPRLVKHRGLAGALLVLPLIALGGYTVIAAGVGFSVVRWIKTAENATDYSIMNTARQLLWLPTSREEKYKAKQAIDTFFVRAGDVLSAGVVFVGATVLHLTVGQFAAVNVAFTAMWMLMALRILGVARVLPQITLRPAVPVAAAILVMLATTPALAQQTRQEQMAAAQAEKAAHLHPYESTPLETRLQQANDAMASRSHLYPFLGSTFEGGGLAAGPGYRTRYGDSGSFDTHAAWSIRNYKAADATLTLPTFADGRLRVDLRGNWIDAPAVAFFGTGDSRRDDRTTYAYRTTTIGSSLRMQVAPVAGVGGGLDALRIESTIAGATASARPDYLRSRLFAEIDSRPSPGYARRGGLYRVEWSDYRQTNDGAEGFTRIDAEARQFVPLMRENWVLAFRALASTTTTAGGNEVPYFLMPDLGGSHTLRGYSAWRFRDRNRMLLSGEYRWTAGPFVDMALFVDAGQVAPRFSGLDWRDVRKTYGIGVSVHTPSSTVTRIEVARTAEGTSLGLSFGPSF
jgi:AAA family ATP:ADP antiporter